MNKKVIFLDIDGTLTEPGTNIPPQSALEAIQTARNNGHYVFLCTGRSLGMLQSLLQYDFDGVVASSGGYILCKGKVIHDSPMEKEQQLRLTESLKKNGIYQTLETLDGSYTEDSLKEFLLAHADEEGNSELLRWRRQIEAELNIRSIEEYKNQLVYKIVIMFQSRNQIEKVKEELGDEFHYVVQDMDQNGFVNGEILSSTNDKGKGVRIVCEALGIPVEDSIGFGDSINDIEMMETTGLSICMANGTKTLKDMADEICPAVDEDGIYQAFLKHGLIG